MKREPVLRLACPARSLHLPEAQARFERFRVGDIECCGLSDGAMVPLSCMLSSDGNRLLFIADVVAHPVVSIGTPDVYPMDMDPDRVVRTRHELIVLLSAPGRQAFTLHFPWPSLGRVHGENGKAAWTPATGA